MKQILLTIITFSFSIAAFSQKDLSGIWEGTLNIGIELQLDFHLNKNNETWQASLDIPQQQVKEMKASNVIITADSVKIEYRQIGGGFFGKLSNDSTISGSWKQGTILPLLLKRVKEVSTPKRPQTPQPPFPYNNEEVVYFNKDKSIQYGATITIPQGKGPFPAVLLITGSGQQNRDEEILGHKPFAVIADFLTRKGYIVLRVDDRGKGQTTGDLTNATTRDFANDAEISLDYLKSRKEVDPHKIGLIGHSEGGAIAEMIAAERKDIDFIILLAGPGVPIIQLMTEQNIAVHESAGWSKEYANQFATLYKSLITVIAHAQTQEEARSSATAAVSDWIAKTPAPIVTATTAIKDDQSKERFVNQWVQEIGRPWLKYFINYNPDPYLRQISAKVLALNGDKDIQVLSKSNLAGLEASLKKSKSKLYEVKEIKGVNHLFQLCNTCTVAEYGQLEETFSPEVLAVIAAWMNKAVSSR